MKYARHRAHSSLNDDDFLQAAFPLSKAVPSSHYTQHGFVAYRRAESRNRRLNLSAAVEDSFDGAEQSSRMNKAEEGSISKTYIASRYPATLMGWDLEHKISMLNAYSELDRLTSTKPKKPVSSRHISMSVRSKAKDHDFSLLKKQFTRDNRQSKQDRVLTKPPNKVLQTIDRLFKRPRQSISKPPSRPHQKASLTPEPFRAMMREPSYFCSSKLVSLLRSTTEKRSLSTELARNIGEA
jgi:hypothetical protein